MDLRSCSKCGKMHPRGYRCNQGRVYSRTDDDRLRSRYQWTKKALQIKDDALGLCEYCKSQGLITYDDLEVHHIVKIRDNPEGLLDDENLVCLCNYHHRQADAGEIDAEFLKELAWRRINES